MIKNKYSNETLRSEKGSVLIAVGDESFQRAGFTRSCVTPSADCDCLDRKDVPLGVIRSMEKFPGY